MALHPVIFAVVFLFISKAHAYQQGRVNISTHEMEDFHCHNVTFSQPFSGNAANIRIQVSLTYDESIKVYDPAVLWVESVTIKEYTVCVLELGPQRAPVMLLDWFAYKNATASSILSGRLSYPLWTTRTHCLKSTFNKPFSRIPRVLATVLHLGDKKMKCDAMHVWAEDVTKKDLKICVREAITFSGSHENIYVDWTAFVDTPKAWKVTENGEVKFNLNAAPSKWDNFAYCKEVNLTYLHYEPPFVLVNARHVYDNNNANSISPDENAIPVWIQYTTKTSFKVCIKDLAGLSTTHDDITVDFTVLGHVDPCLNKTCNFFAVCQAFGPVDGRCVCVEQCPSYQETVCASDGRSFDNKCLLEREICQNRSKIYHYHPGSCDGFPLQRGRLSLPHNPSWEDKVCGFLPLKMNTFYPDKAINFQVSINYFNHTDNQFVHDAAVSWVESTSTVNFTVCVKRAGENDRLPKGFFANVDWIAYQGAPAGGITGVTRFNTWWTGTQCQHVSIPSGHFSSTPTVIVTSEHHQPGKKHDAASVWVEDVSKTRFDVCMRELQNFDGFHEDLSVIWMAFEDVHRPFFSEHGKRHFPNTNTPSAQDNFAFCQDVNMTKNYTSPPTVLVTAKHSTAGNNVDPVHNGMAVWVEGITTKEFRVCLKELFEIRHDPLDVTYAVLSDICPPDWTFYGGFCYLTVSECDSWHNASAACVHKGTNLASVRDQEENVYIQHQHGGQKAWIGLNDILVEGNFKWTDGSSHKFRNWADNEPNNYKNQDCVHTLGMSHSYKWNDVSCDDCHPYTCKRDVDECVNQHYLCDRNAHCQNSDGSYLCICNSGYSKSGDSCVDVNECSSGTHNCGSNAVCTNTVGSFYCTCKTGYSGNGVTCTDINECSTGSHSCHAQFATCSNNAGSYSCSCKSGYTGNGRSCTLATGASCLNLKQRYSGYSNGIYTLRSSSGVTFSAYCDMNNGGWTLVARFSNADYRNWMASGGYEWYSRTSLGSPTSYSSNYDMVSYAFSGITGNEFKLTRSDDYRHTALMYTRYNCLGGRSFRSKLTGYAYYRNGVTWSNGCRGSCSVSYGGSYSSTEGFGNAQCDGVQNRYKVGFWCSSGTEGAVLLIGGGCNEYDHGIGVTEDDVVRLGLSWGTQVFDFASDGDQSSVVTSYSLNLWVR